MENMTLELAEELAALAGKIAAERYGAKPFTTAVCDKDGFLVLFKKQDGAKLLTIGLTPCKAYTAARMGVSTRDFLQRLQKEQLDISYFADAKFTALPGGVPIYNAAGKCIGALGIGGLAQDGELAEEIAAAAGQK